MGLFVSIRINQEKCKGIECKLCIEACPMNIFETNNKIKVIEENEDECTFCDLCLKRCPEGAITIKKNWV